MLLLVEKGIRGGIYHSIYRYAKADHKYTKDFDKNKESPYLQSWDANNLYGWEMSQILPVNEFECIKGTSQFNEDFIKKLCWRKWWRIFSWSWCSILWEITWTS